MTGRQPYLIQVAAAALFDATCENLKDASRYLAAGKLCYDRVASHFEDVWQHLSAIDQTALVMLALPEMKTQIDGYDFVTTDLGRLEWYGPALARLHELGIIERINRHSGYPGLTFWQGAYWRIAARAFVWWMAEHILDETYHSLSFERWLQDKEHQGVFTSNQIEKLHQLMHSIVVDDHSSSVVMIKSVVAEMLK